MANDLTSNPLIITTPAVIRDRSIDIERMEYHPSNKGHVLTIKDRNGRVVWDRQAWFFIEYQAVVEWNVPYTFNGFEVTDIDQGDVLYVWLKVKGI